MINLLINVNIRNSIKLVKNAKKVLFEIKKVLFKVEKLLLEIKKVLFKTKKIEMLQKVDVDNVEILLFNLINVNTIMY